MAEQMTIVNLRLHTNRRKIVLLGIGNKEHIPLKTAREGHGVMLNSSIHYSLRIVKILLTVYID
jgi:hypothetical protein